MPGFKNSEKKTGDDNAVCEHERERVLLEMKKLKLQLMVNRDHDAFFIHSTAELK